MYVPGLGIGRGEVCTRVMYREGRGVYQGYVQGGERCVPGLCIGRGEVCTRVMYREGRDMYQGYV